MRRLWRMIRHFEWRWIVAHAWDRIFPRSCWAETACWAMRYPDGKLGACTGAACEAGREPIGCWCGKFRSVEAGEGSPPWE